MTRLVEQVVTALPATTAFAYVADFSHQSEWDPNTLSSKRVDSGPLGVGSRFELEVKLGRRTAPMLYQITVYDPPMRVVLVGEGSGVWSSDEITFSEGEDGTRVAYVAEIKLRGLLGIVQPLLGGAFARIARAAVGGMRDRLEDLARQASLSDTG